MKNFKTNNQETLPKDNKEFSLGIITSSMKDNSEEGSGISKIKQKLSLKVMIPEMKAANYEKKGSIDSEPKVKNI